MHSRYATERLIAVAVRQASGRIGEVIQMLYDGVAFQEDGRTYIVFSHEGDEIGPLTTQEVCYAISIMRQHGRAVGKTHHYIWDPVTRSYDKTKTTTAFTFGWVGWFNDLK
jgi:hypothetical protein